MTASGGPEVPQFCSDVLGL